MRHYFHVSYMILLLLIVGFLSYKIFAPFLTAIFLAFIFSHLFKSWYEAINKRFGNRKSLASLVSCILIVLLFILPIVLVSIFVIAEVNQTYQSLQQTNWNAVVAKYLNHPLLSQLGISREISTESGQITSGLQNIGNFFFQAIKTTYQGATHFIFMTVVMFFTLYYFFKDGASIQKKIIQLSPLKNSQEEILVGRFLSVSKATLKGSLVIAIIQGTLQGILFWIVGVPSPVFWGLITTFFALIPMLGAAVVWLPTGIILLATGSLWQGIVVLIIGALVISTIDNFLRPALVGNQASLHPLLVFFSTLGGIAVFGLTGILLGPIVVVLFITLMSIYQAEFKNELKQMSKE